MIVIYIEIHILQSLDHIKSTATLIVNKNTYFTLSFYNDLSKNILLTYQNWTSLLKPVSQTMSYNTVKYRTRVRLF